ncbi:capZ-interacting protein isoform X2 [Mugil cephalus]|uniref:capZ-interacting protein isoform X2 n=1 Tax=Mugil cephalus TaxID=48193 RepID=UPI001FB7E423|nr:capZ-interacting protein isoform X2 [Mugil cephalus]
MEDSPSKPSVAELAGRFKGHIFPTPTSTDELPFRRNPPCSLKLPNQTDDNEESDKSNVAPNPFKIKMRNSGIIEKLQANLALSPNALLPAPKNPEVKLQPAPLSPTTTTQPCIPHSPPSPTLRPSRQSSEEEEPIGFDSPPEGTPLPSFNKTRARLSFKRRPPTRQHRRSGGEETDLSPCELCSPKENGDQVLDSPAEEAEFEVPGSLNGEENKDCGKAAAEAAKADADGRGDPERDAEQARSSEASMEEQQPPEPVEHMEGDFKTEEGQEEMHQGGNEMV